METNVNSSKLPDKTMDKFFICVALIVWIGFTFCFILTVVGMFLFPAPQSPYTYGRTRSTWMQIGYDLTQKLIN